MVFSHIFVLFIFNVLVNPGAMARTTDLLPSGTYVSGRQLCEHMAETLKGERGFYIDVPLDYNDPHGPKTAIYGFFPHADFDQAKPTVIYFSGGPGFSAHHAPSMHSTKPLSDAGYNILMFDQRGLGCSRPATKDLYEQKSIYSSVNTARDANALREALGLERVAIVGGSYGTVPATIFSSIFKFHTQSTTLVSPLLGEGGAGEYRERYIDFFARQPQAKHLLESSPRQRRSRLLRRIEELVVTRGTMDLAEGISRIADNVEQFSAPWQPPQITTWGDLFAQRDMHVAETIFFDEQLLTMETNLEPKGYTTSRYPLTSPVTYIVGTRDPRTTPTMAVRLYKETSAQVAQLVMVVGAGHQVLKDQVEDFFTNKYAPTPYPFPLDLIRAAIDGRPYSPQSCAELLLGTSTRALVLRRERSP